MSVARLRAGALGSPRHRRLAPKVFVVWLYVAISGPVCYWMLKDYYPISDAEMERHLNE